MKKTSRIFFSLLLPLLFLGAMVSGCATVQMTTKGEEFPKMYEESPVAILVLPPINESTAADAKQYYATTVQEAISYWGFYIFPYEITTDILKMEGLYDTELLLNMPISKFREYFGADAVLFTTIKKWDLSYIVIASTLTVAIEAELKSTITEQTLWSYRGTVVVDLSGGQQVGGGLAGIIAQLIITAVNSAVADYVPYAKQANYRALSTLPFGKYHPDHMTDQSMSFPDLTPGKTDL
ncbi:conserved exported hypothetical protein [uncultured Desulfatiglans sp.]|uniref:Lipoprotein n=1 Tax=Uncultured Desulfatiglans sp. TaxID=1748965 RepID=A0A653AG15_UNCDX|nr:DUF799 family lipoprotein [Syntrophaceae bacterium]VBB47003.1 conserved exported hypothetical protein [uncultured Desulfatiglans sp.]